jgi:hypothetical protein
MGWTFFNDTGETTGAICTREFNSTNPAGDRWSVVDQSTRGSVWYGIGRLDRADQPPVFYGLVWLTSRKNGQFGYKSMTDCMGPYRWDMPKRLLDQLDQLAPNAPQSALDWRAKCRAKLADKRKPAREFSPGQLVQFGPGRAFELVKPAGARLGWFVKLANQPGSMTYRANARQMAACTVI